MQSRSFSFAPLRKLSVKLKLIIFCGLLGLNTLLVGAASIYINTQQGKLIKERLSSSQQKLTIASDIQNNILSMAAGRANLIASESTADIRLFAISTIKSAAALDENAYNLQQLSPGNDQIKKLLTHIKDARPLELEVIKFAKNNDNEQALTIELKAQKHLNSIKAISSQLISTERNSAFNDISLISKTSTQKASTLATATLLITSLFFLLSINLAHKLSNPIKDIERLAKSIAEGDLRSKHVDNIPKDEIGSTINIIMSITALLRHIVSNITDNANNLGSEGKPHDIYERRGRQV